MSDPALDAAVAKLTADGAASSVIAAFIDRYRRFAGGETGYVHEDDLTPLTDPPLLTEMEVNDHAIDAIGRTAVIRLNGGLGTSMGLAGPKCLIPVRDGLSFLDIVVRQILALRQQYNVRLPLILMDSYNTSDESLAALAAYPDIDVGELPLDFLQSREPKLLADTRFPVEWPADPELEWCPPGHGDFVFVLPRLGATDPATGRRVPLPVHREHGQPGALPDPAIAGWFAESEAPYAAEVTERTDMDRKGGHLAHRKRDGRLVLRDTAQVAPDEMGYFIDIERHPWTHCNNLWINLEHLVAVLDENRGSISPPLIVNRKTVDPADPDSPCTQLEAIGAAVEAFDGARAIGVPRSRFPPVKSTADLLLLRSDVYDFTADASRSPSGRPCWSGWILSTTG